MLAIPSTLNIPIYRDESGALRIGNTRVLLYLVIRAFQRGETPESIVQMYTTLALGDVYAVICLLSRKSGRYRRIHGRNGCQRRRNPPED